LGMGDGGLGIGDWAQSPIPNPQSPIPNPQNTHFSFLKIINKIYYKMKKNIYINSKKLTSKYE